jgi:hypothetical protein
MNPPSPDAGNAERVKDTVQLLVETGGLLGMLWAFIARVLKPYHDYRQAQLARTIREVMVPVLAPIHADHDLLIDIALDNRDRHDETNELLDFLGFTSDRRTTSERRDEVAQMVTTLAERRRVRRRSTDA